MDTLQALRALAALMVAAFHLHSAAVTETGSSGLFLFFQRGEIGVDLFFVLSGFIITWSALCKTDLTARAFLAARFWRVLPPYWAALALYLTAFMGLALMSGDMSRLPDGAGLLTSFLLLPLPDHVVVVAWSLTLEILFYGIFAMTWFRADKRLFIAVLATWAIAALIAERIEPPDALALLLHAAVPEFLLGVAVAWTIIAGRTKWQRPALILGTILVALGVTGSLDPFEDILGRSIAFGVPAAILIYGATGMCRALPRWILTSGDASYLFYLLHLLVFYAVGHGIEMLAGFNVYTSPLAMLAMLVLACFVAVFFHYRIERPYQRWYRNYKRYQSSLSPMAFVRRFKRS